MEGEHEDYEALIASLNDDATLAAYREPLDHYRVSFIPRLFAGVLIWSGNLIYGRRPSYRKFRAIEIIARVPYHSWASAAFTLLTLFYADEARAMRLSAISRFATFAADNETMHVVVISNLARTHAATGFLRRTFIPLVFGFIYFWGGYLIYLVCPRYSLEMNYLFEHHAFEQYDQFLKIYERELKHAVVESSYLAAYGRHPRSQYEFIRSIRNDELVHRNRSVHEITLHRSAKRQSEKGG